MKLKNYLIFCLLLASISGFAWAEEIIRVVTAQSKDGKLFTFTPRTVQDLPGFRHPTTLTQLDEFGGDTSMQLRATGFFRVEQVADRFWLVTPAGHPFFHVAMDSVNVSKSSPTLQENLTRSFGDVDRWRDATVDLLTQNGFNGTGNWSNDSVLQSAKWKLAYSFSVNFMANYGRKQGKTHLQPGHLGYPNDCILCFDPEFEQSCDDLAKKLAAKKDDPNLLGYYTDNELPFELDALDRFLKNDPGDPGRLAAEQLMDNRHGKDWKTISPDDSDRQAWMQILAEKYFSITSAAIRKYDPNHLILGSRFHGSAHRNPALFRAAGKYVDAISYNLYLVWSPKKQMLDDWRKWSGRPCLITEFYAKASDSGMKNTGGAGWTVADQPSRGLFYQSFVLGLIESKSCVGWHWLRYIDNVGDDKAADPSNRDSNKGIVNSKFEPYRELLGSMRELNTQVYDVARYFDQK